MGIELGNDTMKLSQLNRFGQSSVIHITHTSGSARGYSVHEQNIQNIEILLRNAEECNIHAKRNIDASQRERFTSPIPGTEIDETFPTFGDMTERVGQLMVTYSTQLHRMADILSKDERMRPETRKYAEAEQVIKNNIDTAKYIAPMMKNLTATRVNLANNTFFSS